MTRMAAPVLLHRIRFRNFKHFTVGALPAPHRLWCSATSNSSSDQADDKVSSASISSSKWKEPCSCPRWGDDPDYRKWKDKEEEILRDTQPIVLLAKDMLHSGRYMDGEQLAVEDEKAIAVKLLAYYPHYEDKIGCGLESIIVDRHPQFRHSRCLFVVRTDGS